jgi:redox-regulated HSP33 family molecular chaperone
LNDLYRTRASLLLMQPLPEEIQATLDQFEAVCDDLAAAIALTNELEQKRRNTMIDERLTQDIYQRVRCETQFLLSECLRERVVANGHIAEPVELLLS